MKYADQKDLPQGSDGQKIGALYRLYMDSVGRNKLGYEPILPYLKQVRAIKTREEALQLMADFDAKGFNTAPYGLSLGLNEVMAVHHCLRSIMPSPTNSSRPSWLP